MKNIFSSNKIKNLFPHFLVTTIAFYFLKTAFWFLTYLFVICFAIVVILFFLNKGWKFNFLKFFKPFAQPLILTLIIIIVTLFNKQWLNLFVLKDLMLISVEFTLFLLLFWMNKFLNQDIPVKFTNKLLIYTITIIGILNICKSILISILSLKIQQSLHISSSFSLANDYNFFSLFFIFALVFVNFKLIDNNFKLNYSKIEIFFLNFIFIINIFLSASRRGIVVLFILILLYFFYKAFDFIKNFNIELLKKKIGIIFFAILLSFILFYFIIPRKYTANIINRYAKIIGFNDIEYFESIFEKPQLIKSKILIDRNSFIDHPDYWKVDSVSGTTHVRVETPYGEGIQIARKNGDGGDFSLRYEGPEILYFSTHRYKINFKIKFILGDSNSFNIGWLADDGNLGYKNVLALEKKIDTINNSWYNFSAECTFMENHIGIVGFINSVKDSSEFIISEFELTDLDYNEELPQFKSQLNETIDPLSKLNEINPPLCVSDSNLIINGNFKYDLNFWNTRANAINIEIEEFDKKNCLKITRGNGDGGEFSLVYTGNNFSFIKDNEYELTFKTKLIKPNTYLPYNVGYWLNEGNGYLTALKTNIDTIENGWLNVTAVHKFKENQNNLIFPINSQIDFSEFLIADICLVNLTEPQVLFTPDTTSNIEIESISIFDGRSTRLKYALELWKNNYKWYNKLFGKGFDYISLYAQKFQNNPKLNDYPHNPFITILLYSGILGLLAYLWLLYNVVLLYIKYYKKYGIFFIGFLITFFFTFFSGGNPFDPPIMGFFIMLPFFIHSIHKNDLESSQNIVNIKSNIK